MSHYKKHVFVCVNQRPDGKKCCNNANGEELFSYMKEKCKSLKLHRKGEMRINKSGCLDMCAKGPVLVIYPDNVWYKIRSKDCVDKIIDRHLINNDVIKEMTF